MKSRAAAIGAVVVLASIGAAWPLAAQSLADVAKAEETRRETIKEPSKTYTNKDLEGAPGPTISPAAGSTAPAMDKSGGSDKPGGASPSQTSSDAAGGPSTKPADAAKSGAEGGAPAPNDQAAWAARMKTLRDQLEHDRTYADALQTRVNVLTADFAARDDPAQRAVIGQNRQKAVDELDKLKTTLDKDQKAIADLEEQARRASVPPGWLR